MEWDHGLQKSSSSKNIAPKKTIPAEVLKPLDNGGTKEGVTAAGARESRAESKPMATRARGRSKHTDFNDDQLGG